VTDKYIPARSEVGEQNEIRGYISNIQRFSLHDGPGIRTLVFMQGCPLRCKWCCNPEGQKHHPQLRFISVRCAAGGRCQSPCVAACPEGAITLSKEGKLHMDWSRCQNCGKCTEVCLYGARTMLGQEMTVAEVLAEVEQDRSFYDRSGGGVTIGGGEPLAQFEFVLELLKRCQARFLHTAIETCGHVAWRYLKEASEYLDLMYYDIKHIDSVIHKELTGVSNDLILRNAKRVLSGEVECDVIIRTEVIPGCNDSVEVIAAIAHFVAESRGKMMELLPYHALGSAKYRQLGVEYELPDIKPPSEEHMQKLRKIVESFGLMEMTGVY
jgi:pyruvate formate lyase activating enzyme